jgi:serine/threonine protein kinase
MPGPMQGFGAPARPAPPSVPLDPSQIQCSRCGSIFKGTRAQIQWRDRNGDPSLLVCERCKDLERMANDKVHGYELLDVLGKGAMGIVYKARRQEHGDIVALKIVNLEGDPNGLKNFIREARTGSSVQHPNCVRTLEMGESSGKFYLAMEFVDGRTLEDMVKEAGSLDQNTLMRMTYVLLDTLEVARKANIVHRDLKPANILVSRAGDPKITDFGLAKLISDAGNSGLTAPGDLRGTPMFMPPEQLENAATVDHRADLYALGATIYNAATGAYPFNVKTLRDLCMALEHEEPTPICQRNNAISPHFSGFIQKMMEKDPKKRFQSAADAQIELRRVREKILAGG